MSLRKIKNSAADFAERTIMSAEDMIENNAECAVKASADSAPRAEFPQKKSLEKAARSGARAKFVGNAIERGVDAGRSFVNGFVESVIGFGKSVIKGVWLIVQGAGKILNPAPLRKIFQGDVAGARQNVKSHFTSGVKDVGRGFLKAVAESFANAFIVSLNGIVSAIQTLVRLEPPSRALNNQEISELRKVYGDAIDYSQIRLKEGSLGLNQLLAPHTVGNTIYLPAGWLDKNSSTYRASRNQLLIHETAHVWQHQKGGTDYISASLYHQAKGALGGSRGAAYKFEQSIRNGKSWADLNPEQQARLIEEVYVQGLFDDSNAKFKFDDGSDQTAFVRAAVEQMRKGRGAA